MEFPQVTYLTWKEGELTVKILVINGPNLNMLGIREVEKYGNETYEALLKKINIWAKELGVEIETYQSNHEGALIDKIQSAYGEKDGIIINPGAYTHTSIAIMDALKSVNLPSVEVHLTNIHQREEFRGQSYPAKVCLGSVVGLGTMGYYLALMYLKAQYLEE